ncbi:MAG: hypothetical protein AB7G28_07855 [Pirellulales bacterium]
MARKLRIAWSVFFGLLTVALCVLWVHSYWQRVELYAQFAPLSKNRFGYESATLTNYGGQFLLTFKQAGGGYSGALTNPGVYSSVGEYDCQSEVDYLVSRFGTNGSPRSLPLLLRLFGFHFSVDEYNYGWDLLLPDWSLVAITAVFTVLPIAPNFRRFSLRTLLLAVTMLAIVLGLVICLTS